MKKSQQIEIEIRQREVSLAIQRGASGRLDGSSLANDGAAAERPKYTCPACGTGWVLLFDASAAVPPVTRASLRAMLAALSLHVHASASGHLWICSKSFDHLKESSR